MIDTTRLQVAADPFPHVVLEQFLDPEFYARLRADFPTEADFDAAPKVGPRSGRDIYRGDEEMEKLLRRSSGWREFHGYLNSSSFLADTIELFGAQLETSGFALPAESLRFREWTEPRGDLVQNRHLRRAKGATQRLSKAVKAEDIYCRLDIHQGIKAYAKPVHTDRPNRVASMILYFADADEIGCVGGDLSIHAHIEDKPISQYERHPAPQNTTVVSTLRPRENLGVFFLCSNNSYHSVSEIQSLSGYRDFVYINLSSRSDRVWR